MLLQDKAAILVKTADLEREKLTVKILEPHDLTFAQYNILKFLLSNPPCTVRQVDIEQNFSMRNPTVTSILQNMEKKGLIMRVINAQDNRSKIICLTEKAKSMEALLYQLGERLEDEFTKNLTSAERKQLILLLRKLLGM